LRQGESYQEQAHDPGKQSEGHDRTDSLSALPTEPVFWMTRCVGSAPLDGSEMRLAPSPVHVYTLRKHQIETLHEIKLQSSSPSISYSSKNWKSLTSATPVTTNSPWRSQEYQETPRIEPRRIRQDPPIVNSKRQYAITCSYAAHAGTRLSNLGKHSNIDFLSIGDAMTEVFDSLESPACTLDVHPLRVRQRQLPCWHAFPSWTPTNALRSGGCMH
jgi:hypothetical protein